MKRSTKHTEWLAIVGTFLYTGPLWAFLGTFIGMNRAFQTLSNSSSNSEKLAQDISFAIAAIFLIRRKHFVNLEPLEQ